MLASLHIYDWLYWVLIIGYIITILSIIGIILSENRNPLKSLAWVTVLLLLPVGGIILYIFFGRSIKNTHMISRRKRRRLRNSVDTSHLVEPPIDNFSDEARLQLMLGRSLTGSRFFAGNEVEIFFEGKEKFDSLCRDLQEAQSYIHLQYYIIEDDTIGNRVKDILIERAKAGVKVRVIYDHIGSIHVKKRFFRAMKEAGIEAHPFFRVAFPPFATRINWRNHRKLCVIDGRVGYIGGMNIADRYIDGGKFGYWRDTHLRITGPAINSLLFSFAVDWIFMGQPLVTEPSSAPSSLSLRAAGMQLITSGPTSEWTNVAFVLLKAIGHAKKRIYIQTPYFLPTESMLRALQAAALSRVDVRVMIPLHSDSKILTHASNSYIYECLRAGIKIYLYEKGMLHSKVVVIDDEFSSVGSTNIDFRSFEHNFECNMMIYSAGVNQRLRHQFLEDQRDSRRVRAAQWRRRPLPQKAMESIVRLLSPIL